MIFNLSAYTPTSAEMAVLCRGLGFVPMVSNHPFEHIVDNYRFTRELRLREHFSAQDNEGGDAPIPKERHNALDIQAL